VEVSGTSSSVPKDKVFMRKKNEPLSFTDGIGLVPPEDARERMRLTRGTLGRDLLAYIGDTVWEFMVLRHQYMQVVRSPFTTSQGARNTKQAKAANMLFNSGLLTKAEKEVLIEGGANTWKKKVKSNLTAVTAVGIDTYQLAMGLRTLLGYLYMDQNADDSRMELIARKIGIFSAPGQEDQLLGKLTEGIFDPESIVRGNFFLALAPLGHAALRLYISRYLCIRPLRAEEFIYRVKMALRAEELDLAAVGFMRDDATPEEVELMKGARDQSDSYAFAFECLLGHLALKTPYRLHQVVSSFGFAKPLKGTTSAWD